MVYNNYFLVFMSIFSMKRFSKFYDKFTKSMSFSVSVFFLINFSRFGGKFSYGFVFEESWLV